MASTPHATGRTWCGLIVLVLPALLTSMDVSVLFVAGPAIAETLRPTATQWLWAMDVYGFVLAGLLITMGSLGDRIGRRTLLLAGALCFGGSSALLAWAPGPELLIAARALMAVGGATLAPSTLALIRALFAHEDQRRTAVGVWTVAFTGGAVIGPIVAGVLLEYFWWGAVFLINVPVMALLLATAPLLLPEIRSADPTPFDLPGAAMSLAAVMSLVYVLKHVAEEGFTPTAIAVAGAGLAAALGFLARQRSARHPLVDLALFRVRAFAAAVGANTTVAMAVSGLGVLAFPFLQSVHGMSPLESALWALPTLAGTLAGTQIATVTASRVSNAGLLTAGLVVAAVGFTVIATLDPASGVGVFVGGYTILTLGVGMTATTANAVVLSTASSERAGAAAGISETSTELGAGLGIAVLGTLASLMYRRAMADANVSDIDPAAAETVGAAVASARQLSGDRADALLDAAFGATTGGITAAAGLGALFTVTVAVVLTAALRLGRSGDARRTGDHPRTSARS
ncbi:MAG TPA: MFS transporter [Actinopolymorphaceae bacterium]